jgi:RHS repeat-associated protein
MMRLTNSTETSVPSSSLFTGKERDAESGNDYFGARYYSSALGRFMSPDWSAKVEPVPYACPSFFSHVITGDALA